MLQIRTNLGTIRINRNSQYYGSTSKDACQFASIQAMLKKYGRHYRYFNPQATLVASIPGELHYQVICINRQGTIKAIDTVICEIPSQQPISARKKLPPYFTKSTTQNRLIAFNRRFPTQEIQP